MRRILLPIVIVSFIIIGFAPSRMNVLGPQKINEIIQKLKYYGLLANERTMVHTDKDYYEKGETIWFRVYLTNGLSNVEKPYSGVVYVEVLNRKGDIVEKRKLKVSGYGANGEVSIKNNWDSGKYYIRAFTKLMLNNDEPRAHVKPILVENSGQSKRGEEFGRDVNISPEILIEPEGGSFVGGVVAAVGVKAINGEGEMLGEKGTVVDDRNNVVTNFELISPGYGKAYFTPQVNRKYRLIINSGTNVFEKQLPEVLKKGFSLRLKERPDYIVVSMTSTNENGLNGCVLLAHSDETLLAVYELGIKNEESTRLLRVNKKDLGEGVVSFSLFDQVGNAKCQRSLSLNQGNEHFVGLQVNKEVYKKGEPIILWIDSRENFKGDISLSVVSKERTKREASKKDLVFRSMRDPFASSVMPVGLKNESSVKRKEVLDAMMILDSTHLVDWEKVKRFNINEIVHKPELGIMVSGNVTFKNHFKSSKSTVLLTASGGQPFQETSMINTEGDFEFGPYAFYDSLNVLVHVNNLRTEQLSEGGIDIDIDIFDKWPKFNDSETLRNMSYTNPVSVSDKKQLSENELSNMNGEVTQLDEVVVKSDVESDWTALDREFNKLTPYFSYNKRIVADSLSYRMGAISALDLLIQVPGVVVRGIYPTQRILIRGVGSINESTDPLFLINGVPASADAAKQLLADEVMFVDIIKGASAAAFGSRGSNGVIAFYTKRGKMYKVGSGGPVNWVNATIFGFSRTHKYEDYVKLNTKGEDGLGQSLLYWNPMLTSGKDSIVQIGTEHAEGTYSVVLRGLDQNGNPIHVEKTIEVIE